MYTENSCHNDASWVFFN